MKHKKGGFCLSEKVRLSREEDPLFVQMLSFFFNLLSCEYVYLNGHYEDETVKIF